MKELNQMMNLTFSTPVEADQKQQRMLDEINQRKKTSREFIEQLSTRLVAVTQEKDTKVRAKEDQLDEIKQALQQARATEAALLNDDGAITEEIPSQEESLKQSLAEAKQELLGMQRQNSDDEGKQHRALRKEEEALQTLLRKYDEEMTDLTEKIKVARAEAEKREKELAELQKEYDEIEKKRTPLRDEETKQKTIANTTSKTQQDIIAAVTVLQSEIRKYLRTAPKIAKKKKGKKKKA